MKISFKNKIKAENEWGRWGGGWDWKLGICIGKSEMIIELLVFMVRIYWGKD